MRKATFLFSFLLLAGIALMFTACNKDDDDPDDPQPTYYPTIDFKGGGDYVSSDVTVDTGANIHIGITAAMNATSKEDLRTFTVTRVVNNTPEVIYNEEFKEENYSFDSVFVALGEAATAKYIFTVKDDDAKEAEVSLNVTTVVPEPQYGEINYFEGVVLGSFNDQTGSFYSVSENMVYTIAEANAASEKIDFVYYYGAVNKASIGAPDDAGVNQVYNLDAWTTINETRFYNTEYTAEEFDAMENDALLVDLETFEETSMTMLQGEEVFAFMTAGGKKGLIKVAEIPVMREDLITFDVKVQK